MFKRMRLFFLLVILIGLSTAFYHRDYITSEVVVWWNNRFVKADEGDLTPLDIYKAEAKTPDKKMIVELSQKIEDIRKSHRVELQAARDRNAKLIIEKSDLKDEVNKLKRKLQETTKQKDDYIASIEDTNKSLRDEAGETKADTLRRYDMLIEDKKNLKRKVEQLEKRNRTLDSKVSKCKKQEVEIAALKKTNDFLRQSIKDLEAKKLELFELTVQLRDYIKQTRKSGSTSSRKSLD